jgi:hypothetical protein
MPRALGAILSLTVLLGLGACAASAEHECVDTCCEKCCPERAGHVASEPAAVRGRTIEEWTALANDPSGESKLAAADAMHSLGPMCCCRAVAMLSSDDPAVRYTGAEVLRRLGHSSQPAGPLLSASLDDGDWRVRAVAARALGALGEGGASEARHLVRTLESDGNWEVRFHAARALAQMSWHPQPWLDEIERVSRHDLDERVRREAAVAYDKVLREWIAHQKILRRS